MFLSLRKSHNLYSTVMTSDQPSPTTKMLTRLRRWWRPSDTGPSKVARLTLTIFLAFLPKF